MTEKECSTKLLVFKILAIVCLAVVILSGFLPWISLSGDYEEGPLGMFSQMADEIPEDELDTYQEYFDEEGIDFDIEDMIDAIDNYMDPITDGNVSPMDFMALSSNTTELKGIMEEVADIDMGMDSFVMSDEDAEMFDILATIFIIPTVAYGFVAVVALIRLIMHVFNRKGMGVGVCILSVIHVAFYLLVSLLFNDVLLDGAGSASITAVPVITIVCAILNCVFWAQARKCINPVVVEKVVEVTPGNVPPVPQNLGE